MKVGKKKEDKLSSVMKKLESNIRSHKKPASENSDQEKFVEAKEVDRSSDESISAYEHSYTGEVFTELDWSYTKNDEMLLTKCEFHDCNFIGASLTYIDVRDCKFQNCNFKNANLHEATFHNCSFYNQENEKGCYFFGENLTHSKFTKCDVSICIFEKADLFGVEFLDSRAQGASFKGADFTSIVSRSVVFSLASLKNSIFRYADFERCVLKKCDLSDSSFVNANFLRTDLEEANLTGSDLSGIQYEALQLSGADLRNAELGGLDIRRIDMSGAKICDWQQEALLETLGIIVFPG